MTRIDCRRLLKVSGAGAVAASIGGMAAILAAGRAPDYGQTTSLQWLKFVDFVPVSHQLLRGRSQRSARKRSASSSMSRRSRGMESRHASPRQSSRRPAPTSLTSSWRSTTGRSSMVTASPMSATWRRRSARPETALTRLQRPSPTMATNGSLRRLRSLACFSQTANLGGRKSAIMPRVCRCRQETQAKGPAARSDFGTYIWRRARILVPLPLVMGRQRSRGGWKNGRARYQGDGRVGQIHGQRLIKRRLTKAGSRRMTRATIARF